jgi:glycine/D-amino acid oxidase-like deaminating enzyme
MNELSGRYHRNTLLFGAEGQKKLRATRIAIVGDGGLGSPLAQHLALLGVGKVWLIDADELDETSRNRFVGARHDDPVPGSAKVFISARLIKEINPSVEVVQVPHGLVSPEAFAALREADWIFGGLDHDGPRYILNELSAAYAKPYIDLASDVPEPGVYGGRVCVADCGCGCLSCLGLLDPTAVRRYLSSAADRAIEDAIYGINKAALAENKGPSVSPINAVVAGLAATEFMVAVTGLRAPHRFLEYRGHDGKVLVSTDQPRPDCPFCAGIRGKGRDANVERYLCLPQLRAA